MHESLCKACSRGVCWGASLYSVGPSESSHRRVRRRRLARRARRGNARAGPCSRMERVPRSCHSAVGVAGYRTNDSDFAGASAGNLKRPGRGMGRCPGKGADPARAERAPIPQRAPIPHGGREGAIARRRRRRPGRRRCVVAPTVTTWRAHLRRLGCAGRSSCGASPMGGLGHRAYATTSQRRCTLGRPDSDE